LIQGSAKLKVWLFKQANKNFRVFKKPDFSKKSGFSENFMPENLWNLTYCKEKGQCVKSVEPGLTPVPKKSIKIEIIPLLIRFDSTATNDTNLHELHKT